MLFPQIKRGDICVMSDLNPRSLKKEASDPLKPLDKEESSSEPSKGPLSFLSGALTSCLLAWLCLKLSQNIVSYFTLHPPNYNSAIAQSAASGFKTLVIGTSFLATFSFAFIGLGLILVFIRSLFDGKAPNAS